MFWRTHKGTTQRNYTKRRRDSVEYDIILIVSNINLKLRDFGVINSNLKS